jgi:hypothetical protein
LLHTSRVSHCPVPQPTSSRRVAARAKCGFVRIESREAERLKLVAIASEALRDGKLGKGTTSQLALLSDAGIASVQRAIDAAAARGEVLRLEIDVRVSATTASKS